MRRALLLLPMVAIALASPATRAEPPEAALEESKPWLGIGLSARGIPVRVVEVIPGTPAEIAGLEVGDGIVSIDGEAVHSDKDVIDVIQRRRVGDSVDLAIRRRGMDVSVRTQLSAILSDSEVFARRLLDQEAPTFNLPVVAGSNHGRLVDHRGKPTVVAFIAPGCGPCKELYQPLNDLQRKLGTDAVVLAVAPADASPSSGGALRDLVKRHRIGFTVLEGLGDSIRASYRLGANSLPALVVIDRSGVVVYAGLGGSENAERASFVAERITRMTAMRY